MNTVTPIKRVNKSYNILLSYIFGCIGKLLFHFLLALVSKNQTFYIFGCPAAFATVCLSVCPSVGLSVTLVSRA